MKTNLFYILIFVILFSKTFGQDSYENDVTLNSIDFTDTVEEFRVFAKNDIKYKKIKLFLVSGINPTQRENDDKFKNEFNIEYYDFGCVAPKNELIKAYNFEIFKHLSKKYGKSWLKNVRNDIVGLKEYEKSFTNYSISCEVTYLPILKSETQKHKISKIKSPLIVDLINPDSLIINLTDEDLNLFKQISEQRNFEDKKIYDVSSKILEKIFETKEIRLNSMEISKTKLSLQDALSGSIDGAPFNLSLNTKNTTLATLKNNLSTLPKANVLSEYFIFYSIYNEMPFCDKINFGEYFAKENLYKLIISYLSYKK